MFRSLKYFLILQSLSNSQMEFLWSTRLLRITDKSVFEILYKKGNGWIKNCLSNCRFAKTTYRCSQSYPYYSKVEKIPACLNEAQNDKLLFNCFWSHLCFNLNVKTNETNNYLSPFISSRKTMCKPGICLSRN